VLEAVAAFAATNLDDLFLLVAWFAAGRTRTRDIVLGQYAGIGALFGASLAASLLALVVPAENLKWLGVIPVALGMRLFLTPDASVEAPAASGFLAVLAVTVVNGADNLGAYTPLFATSSAAALAVYGAVFAVQLALWCAAARWLVLHPAAGALLRRWGPAALPYALIGIGLWILLR
jgi:cadmium resistance protein CadD (predicted permease)